MVWIRLTADMTYREGEKQPCSIIPLHKAVYREASKHDWMQLRNWHRMWLTHRNEGPGFLDVSQVVVDERGKGSRGQIVLLVDGYIIIGIIVVIITHNMSK